MQDFSHSFALAASLILSAKPELLEIVMLSLRVTITAVIISCVIGFPLGALLAVARFPGRMALVLIFNTLMGLPPVVVGLLTYMLLSNAGPLGFLQLLYTPSAMVIAQAILITPIIVALSRQVIDTLYQEYAEQFTALVVPRKTAAAALLWDARYGLMTTALAGFGRAVAEVGAVIIVGGNIAHVTRVMTTAIALETSKGELALALALGFVLLIIAMAVNISVYALRAAAEKMAYV
ncbi:MAG TPA: ABC transporter permease subunit [Rhizobiales bacterium]|nr:ABC transporter permease subunit [Hyphomicrobiales bacterium]